MPNHPNATVSALSGGLTALLIWALSKYGIHLSEVNASLVVAAASTVALYIGREGVKGALVRIWNGGVSVWNGQNGGKP